jgi:hypothetical protein
MPNPIFALLLDLAFLVLNVFFAITQRGTWVGWLCASIVCWQVFSIVKAIRD